MKITKLIIAASAAITLGSQAAVADTHSGSSLDSALAAQSDEAKARYQYRHPKETLEFFGIQPGMTVMEALPGGGWYSKILLPYLGKDGQLIGVDYPVEMWELYGFMSEERLEKRESWAETWPEQASEWRGENDANVAGAVFGAIPDEHDVNVDAVLFIRALHGPSRFENDGGFLSTAIADTFIALKPGGIVGIVQHEAREDRPDEWADGSNGYIKKSDIILLMETAGFEFVAESDINENELDQAGEGDRVWRLPPALDGAKDDEELKAKMEAIGESHRMTLKFVKPGG